MTEAHAEFDAVEIEVYKHLLASVAEEMGVRLMRSAYSPNIKERRDFSCALFDAEANMIAQAAHIPVHLGSAPASVRAVLDAFDPAAMSPDDRFVVNDPYAGGTHLPDITVVAPVLGPAWTSGASDAPRFFVATRAHHADVGGVSPGSLPIATHIDDEGLRLPPMQLDDDAIVRIADASRTPDERRGDLRAQLAACGVGIDRLTGLCGTHGAERIDAAGRALRGYTARFIRSLVAGMPDGTYAFTDHLDDDGHGTTDIAIRCTITVAGDRANVDFRESDDQVPGPVNAVRAIALSAVMYCFRCLAPADLPSNSGVLDPVAVLTREGSVVDARYPAAVAGGNVETSQRLVDTVFGALARAMPGRVPAASAGTMNNLTIGSPPDPSAEPASAGGASTSFAYYETIAGGAGAGPDAPGGSAIQTHMTNTLNTPVEALEHDYPFRVEACSIRDGSGGHGRHRGGDGMVRRYRFDAPATVTLLTERRARGPWGAAGGGGGEPGVNRLIHPDGRVETLPAKCTITVAPGDRLEVHTPGGGGWGEPTIA